MRAKYGTLPRAQPDRTGDAPRRAGIRARTGRRRHAARRHRRLPQGRADRRRSSSTTASHTSPARSWCNGTWRAHCATSRRAAPPASTRAKPPPRWWPRARPAAASSRRRTSTPIACAKCAPLECDYRGFRIVSAPPPSSGGVVLCEMLNILEGYPLADLRLGLGARRALRDRSHAPRLRGSQSPARRPRVREQSARATARSQLCRGRFAPASIRNRAGDSARLKPGIEAREGTHTTHYSIADKFGNAVSVTYTLNDWFGARVTAGGTGVLLNNEMDDFTAKAGVPNLYGLVQGETNRIEPGKRPLSSMTPTIVLRDGKPWMIVGTPGGSRIITAVMHTMLNVIDYGMDIQEAVDAPRIHQQWLPEETFVEAARIESRHGGDPRLHGPQAHLAAAGESRGGDTHRRAGARTPRPSARIVSMARSIRAAIPGWLSAIRSRGNAAFTIASPVCRALLRRYPTPGDHHDLPSSDFPDPLLSRRCAAHGQAWKPVPWCIPDLRCRAVARSELCRMRTVARPLAVRLPQRWEVDRTGFKTHTYSRQLRLVLAALATILGPSALSEILVLEGQKTCQAIQRKRC